MTWRELVLPYLGRICSNCAVNVLPSLVVAVAVTAAQLYLHPPLSSRPYCVFLLGPNNDFPFSSSSNSPSSRLATPGSWFRTANPRTRRRSDSLKNLDALRDGWRERAVMTEIVKISDDSRRCVYISRSFLSILLNPVFRSFLRVSRVAPSLART